MVDWLDCEFESKSVSVRVNKLNFIEFAISASKGDKVLDLQVPRAGLEGGAFCLDSVSLFWGKLVDNSLGQLLFVVENPVVVLERDFPRAPCVRKDGVSWSEC